MLTKIFKNDENDSTMRRMFETINKQTKASEGVITGKLQYNGQPKIVVVAEEGITGEDITLFFGVSRCTPQDEFDEEFGIKVAKWRAEYHSLLKLVLSKEMTSSDIAMLFYRVSETLNTKFIKANANRSLFTYPKLEEVK